MSKSLMKLSLFSLACTSALACACNQSKTPSVAAIAPSSASASPDTVVAKVGKDPITLADLDKEIGGQLREIEEQQYELRRQGLEQMINERLAQAAAFKKGVSSEQFLKDSVETGVKPPTETAVKEFFDQNSAQLPPGAKLDDYKERIRSFLLRQAKAERAKDLFDELRKGADVEVLLAAPPKPRLEVEPIGPSQGPKDAKVTVVEFSDFECPFCARGKASLDAVIKKYGDKIRVVFRQFPLPFHSHAKKAAEASFCADAQGKFWPYYDALFADQKKLAEADLKAVAKKLGLDEKKFDKCLTSGEMSGRVDEDVAAAAKLHVSGTPAFFINGLALSGAVAPDEFYRLIDQELAAK